MEQSWWDSVVEKWNSQGGTVWWNSGTLMVEQCKEIVEQCRGTVEQSWWDSMVEQSWWDSVVEQWNSNGGTEWWNRRTSMVEQ